MTKTTLIMLMLTLLAGCTTDTQPAQKGRMTLEGIEEMYAGMRADGFNPDAEFLYGYFFTSEHKDGLETAAEELKENFRFVDIYPAEDDEFWWLHVERIERHDAHSLFRLNEELYNLADRFGVEYDGFDLGNTDPTKSLQKEE